MLYCLTLNHCRHRRIKGKAGAEIRGYENQSYSTIIENGAALSMNNIAIGSQYDNITHNPHREISAVSENIYCNRGESGLLNNDEVYHYTAANERSEFRAVDLATDTDIYTLADPIHDDRIVVDNDLYGT